MADGDEKKPETAQEAYERQKREFFDSCTVERNRFIASKSEQSKTYDQTILTFSAGAIALSLTFVEKIAPAPVCPSLLFLAWAGFSLAILSVVVSFVLSQKAFDNEIEWVDQSWAAVREGKAESPPVRPNHYTNLTNQLNLASGLLFVAAFAFLVLFGGVNWPAKKEPTRTITGTPIKIEITGELMPDAKTVVVVPSKSPDFAQAPTPRLLPPVPQPPTQTTTGSTGAPASASTKTDTTDTTTTKH